MVHAGLEDPSWNKKRGGRRGCAESNAISRLAASSGERAVQEGGWMDGWMDVFFFFFFYFLRSAQVSTASQTQCIAQGKSAL